MKKRRIIRGRKIIRVGGRRLTAKLRRGIRRFCKKKYYPKRKKNFKFFNKIEYGSKAVKKQSLLQFINILATQLLVYSRSWVSVLKRLKVLLISAKKLGESPIYYLGNFFEKATLRVFLREFKMRGKKLLIAVPAPLPKIRLSLIKRFLLTVKGRPEEEAFESKLLNEISDFLGGKGETYTYNADAYIISRQNKRQSRFGYNAKAYIKKNNVNKKSKFFYL